MNEQFHVLNDAYRSLLSRTSPSKMSSHELASSMFTCVSELTLDASDGSHSQHQDQSRDPPTSSKYSPNPNGTELACLVLTLVEKISSKLTSQQLSQETSLYFKDVSTVLFQYMDFMSKLVHLACCKDRLLSHLAAKSVSSYVIFELRCFNTVNQIWEWKCLQVLQNRCSGNELDACTWSLTTVLKAVLKETSEYKPGTLEKLLATFDTALTAAYSQLVPVESLGHGNSASYPSSNTADWATTLTNLLALLEVLTAARFKLSTSSVCFTSSRLSLVQASALLRIVHSHVHYFVKKQVLLLLKRILLQKAGEDMGFGEGSSLMHGDDHMTSDILTLADDVLQAVHTDWLQCVPVESVAFFFGGTGQLCGGSSDAFDHVMLRAVSLVVLKSLEYKIKSAGGKGVCNTIGIHGYLSALLLFLSQRGVQLKQGSHSCCWVSLVFGEQDDDMMEAAKALLLLYLHHSISFDHSILLDFLISTETCFLEYFVRYLKHLRDDWEGFRTVCQKIDGSDRCKLSWKISQKDDQLLDNLREELQQSLCVSRGSVSTSSHSGGSVTIVDPEPAPCLQPSLCLPSGSATALASTPPLSLVDYGSSEESETEDDDLPSGLKQDRLHSDSVVHTHNSHSFDRTVMCLTELRVVVTRLQRRSLFPYNATSLLKLLTQIEAKK
ncbi:protein Lines homolog 1 isoform X2 [Salvelinus fontinalis]|uniref:protein Lines homolog 1 isoform X2 n=1 Tax=Salvelinus fontinalis TaxID=8038 RepID=UPI0024850B7D|nr:protein Lines homolog 1 isoform X2 [Salvelinus fontinalis]